MSASRYEKQNGLIQLGNLPETVALAADESGARFRGDVWLVHKDRLITAMSRKMGFASMAGLRHVATATATKKVRDA